MLQLDGSRYFLEGAGCTTIQIMEAFHLSKKGIMYNKFLLTIPLYFWHSCFLGTILKSKKMITFLEMASYPIQKSTARFESWIFRFEAHKRWVPWILVPWSCRSSTSSPSLPEPPWPLSLRKWLRAANSVRGEDWLCRRSSLGFFRRDGKMIRFGKDNLYNWFTVINTFH